MKYQLIVYEVCVIGCLLEKQVIIFEQYLLLVNVVVIVCNQKINCELVMLLSESEVQVLLDMFVKWYYLCMVSGFGNCVIKYEQCFCNFEFGDLKFSVGEVVVVMMLLLCGVQVLGELCSWVQWMYEFSDMVEVESVLEGLVMCEDGFFVVWLFWELGKWESCYMYLFCDDMDMLIIIVEVFVLLDDDGDLCVRVEVLEGEVVELKVCFDLLLYYLGD